MGAISGDWDNTDPQTMGLEQLSAIGDWFGRTLEYLADEGDGKTTTPEDLATALARQGNIDPRDFSSIYMFALAVGKLYGYMASRPVRGYGNPHSDEGSGK